MILGVVSNHRFWCVVAVMVILPSGGCHQALTQQVEGEITLDGVPLKAGLIQFIPIEGTNGPTAGATIEDGRYVVQPVEQGLRTNGVYSVAITSMVESDQMVADPNAPGGKRRLIANTIPAKYNTATSLRVTVSSRANDNRHDFKLESKLP